MQPEERIFPFWTRWHAYVSPFLVRGLKAVQCDILVENRLSAGTFQTDFPLLFFPVTQPAKMPLYSKENDRLQQAWITKFILHQISPTLSKIFTISGLNTIIRVSVR